MAETIDLTVEPRSTGAVKAARKLRRQGLLPGVVYGYNLSTPQPIQVAERTFERVYHRAGNVHLVDLHLSAGGEATQALIHEVTRDPITHIVTHVDFLAVNPREEVTTNVPIVVVGEAPAVRQAIGVLLHDLDTLSVRALPSHTPEAVQADVSGLTEVGATLAVKDLAVPAGVTVLNDPEEIIIHVAHVRAAPAEEVAATAAAELEAGAEGSGAS